MFARMSPRTGRKKSLSNLVSGAVYTTFPGSMTTGATAHVKGSWVSVGTVPFDVSEFFFSINNNAAATNTALLYDIRYTLDGVSRVIVPDAVGSNALRYSKYYPIKIPKGALVEVRAQSVRVSTAVTFFIEFFSDDNGYYDNQSFLGCVSVGVNTGTSSPSTALAETTTGTYPAMTNIGSVTAREFKAFRPMIGLNGTLISPGNNLLIGVGFGNVIYEEYFFAMDSNEWLQPLMHLEPCRIIVPQGTQLQAAAKGSAASTDPLVAMQCFF